MEKQLDMNTKAALADLRRIPGVGKSIAGDLLEMGYRSVEELRGEDPQKMYEQHCGLKGMHVDRCVLYVFRCAVYYAESDYPEPEKLKWWNWSDQRINKT